MSESVADLKLRGAARGITVGDGKRAPDHLIINSPYVEPMRYWKYDRQTKRFFQVSGERRRAMYVRATPGAKEPDDPGTEIEIPLVNAIRPRVKTWREAGYPGVTGITRRLLDHWRDPNGRDRDRRFFFCQLEAIETLIWLTESDPAERAGIVVEGDGGPFNRLCCKLATGSGKTIVMSMAIAWHILNRVANKDDDRFSRHVLVVAPGLTVRNRLAVLVPDSVGNYFDAFGIVPSGLEDRLRLGKVRIINWHKLDWESDEKIAKKRTVDKRGAKSDEAYAREVLEELSNARDLLVINDEAHHAWRLHEGDEERLSRTDQATATKWVGGIDRIHRARGVRMCYDFSATPFVPAGKSNTEDSLFSWIISDFGLNDAIEAGLVKTPRVVVRDDIVPDAKTYKSRLYHIYRDPDVQDDLNRKAAPEEPLPDLVMKAYHLLGTDWAKTREAWVSRDHVVPPVMITVCNRTETAARIEHAFAKKRMLVEELCEPDRFLRIDSKVLDEAESADEPLDVNPARSGEDDTDDVTATTTEVKLTKKQQAELLRQKVDTVGKVGRPGAQIQNVISVGMLSEGWDAKTVTHIMGLRAFTSQLLCEQVVGRGLRRTSYDIRIDENGEERFDPEYVNIFGVPFTFVGQESADDGRVPPPPTPKITIEPDPAKADHEITWPNVLRIDHVYTPVLSIDVSLVPLLELRASNTPMLAELAPVIDGRPATDRLTQIDLEALARKYRLQRVIFETAAQVFDQMKPTWRGRKDALIAQLIGIVEQFVKSDRIRIEPALFMSDPLRQRIMLALNMNAIVGHLFSHIQFQNPSGLQIIPDRQRPIASTRDMRPWDTGRPCESFSKTHINHTVYDSAWEAAAAATIDRHPHVRSWVKNDHLGFEIVYKFQGATHKYRPDFLIELHSGQYVVLEVKGEETDRDRTKRQYLEEWIRAVNSNGGFGIWKMAWCNSADDIHQCLGN